jgi:hypothetical protein
MIDKSDLILITGAPGFMGLKVFEVFREHVFTKPRCLIGMRLKVCS